MREIDYDLERLLRPVEPEAFFRDTWEKNPLSIQRDEPGYYEGLFGLRDFHSWTPQPIELPESTLKMPWAGIALSISAKTR